MSIAQEDFDYLRTLVRQRSAIVLETGKEYLVESRLAPLAREVGVEGIPGLVMLLRTDPRGQISNKVVDAMTTNETSFFRDLNPFEALRLKVLPDLIAARGKERVLNLWCGAASSGQEPYTIAMTLREHFPQLNEWRIRFLATDISKEMLRRSRAGIYSQLEVNRGLPAKYLVKYFEQKGAEWQVRKDLRDMIEFSELNLAQPLPPMPKLDIVFLRNVLIYFDLATKRDILARVRGALHPEGYLFLGGSETTLNVDDQFRREACEKTFVYRPIRK
ncbi:MAG: hypothetical protein RL277_1518 [Planctomycetota bacterium]|jgi:chemotaxis protein methyltransferase CheR